MKKPKLLTRSLLILCGLTVVAFILRIYNIEQVYTTLNRDEASLGYNAYLLKSTGLDEWGVPITTTFLSFGDWKLIGYPLILIGFYHFLPLADWVVRLPSVLSGTILIPITFWLVYNLTKNTNKSLLTAGFVASTPIFFFYSRFAYEANLALTLVVIAICLIFFRQPSVRQLYQDLLAGGLLFYACLTYNTPIFLLPIMILVLVIALGLKNFRLWRQPVMIIFIFWLMAIVATSPVLLNKTGITIFSDATTTLARNNYYQSFSPALRTVLGNQYVFYLKTLLFNIAPSFSYDFLVKSGGSHPWHQLPDWGHISPASYLLILYLVYQVYRQKHKELLPLGLLAVLSLLPSAITIDTPHATRSLVFIYLAVVLGATTIPLDKLLQQKWGRVLLGLIILFQTIYFGCYLYSYFRLDDKRVGELRPGFAQVVNSIYQTSQDKVAIVADGYQYILLSWYLKIPADYYLNHNQRGLPSLYGLRYGERVGQFRFIVKPSDRLSDEKYLIWFDDKTKTWQIE